jgi:FkbM family methyltransferase
LDIGASDGITISNSYFFEKQLGWTGICVEPIPQRAAELRKNRNCICIEGCISDKNETSQFLRISSPSIFTEMLSGLAQKYDPRHLQRIQQELRVGGRYSIVAVKCYRLNDILAQYNIKHIDYLSLDTEGGELDILRSIDFNTYKIDVITVEDNYNDPEFISFLTSQGFNFVQRLEHDLLFVHKNFKPKV